MPGEAAENTSPNPTQSKEHKDVGPIKACAKYNMCWKGKVPPMCKVNPQGYLQCFPVDPIPTEDEEFVF